MIKRQSKQEQKTTQTWLCSWGGSPTGTDCASTIRKEGNCSKTQPQDDKNLEYPAFEKIKLRRGRGRTKGRRKAVKHRNGCKLTYVTYASDQWRRPIKTRSKLERRRISTKRKTSCKHKTETMRIKANCKKRGNWGGYGYWGKFTVCQVGEVWFHVSSTPQWWPVEFAYRTAMQCMQSWNLGNVVMTLHQRTLPHYLIS